jgi:transposase
LAGFEVATYGRFSGGRRGILAWTKHRISSGAVEGMNNKIKSISHRSFGFRTAEHFIAAIYHCCARLPLPVES